MTGPCLTFVKLAPPSYETARLAVSAPLVYGIVQWIGRYETDVYNRVAESLIPDGMTDPSNTATCSCVLVSVYPQIVFRMLAGWEIIPDH